MTQRPYHHGDLRAALLSRAEHTLREVGADGLSLRELARDVGVSHGAPRRHFRDKAALLDALAVSGFSRLSDVLERAAEASPTAGEPGTFADTLTAVAVAYVRFATTNPALLELMFGSKHAAGATAELTTAATETFDRLSALVELGQSRGELVPGDVERLGTVMLATLQGLTSMANTQMIDVQQVEAMTAYAVSVLLHGLAPRPA
jgi:AcrR family transcriptional regulator